MLGVGHIVHFYVSREKNIEYFKQKPCILNCKTQCVKSIHTHTHTHTYTYIYIYIHTNTHTKGQRVGKRIERSAEKEKQDTVKRDSKDIYPFIFKEKLFFQCFGCRGLHTRSKVIKLFFFVIYSSGNVLERVSLARYVCLDQVTT